MLTILIGMASGFVGVLLVTATRPAEAVVSETRPSRTALLHTGQSAAYFGVAMMVVGAVQLLTSL